MWHTSLIGRALPLPRHALQKEVLGRSPHLQVITRTHTCTSPPTAISKGSDRAALSHVTERAFERWRPRLARNLRYPEHDVLAELISKFVLKLKTRVRFCSGARLCGGVAISFPQQMWGLKRCASFRAATARRGGTSLFRTITYRAGCLRLCYEAPRGYVIHTRGVTRRRTRNLQRHG